MVKDCSKDCTTVDDQLVVDVVNSGMFIHLLIVCIVFQCLLEGKVNSPRYTDNYSSFQHTLEEYFKPLNRCVRFSSFSQF